MVDSIKCFRVIDKNASDIMSMTQEAERYDVGL